MPQIAFSLPSESTLVPQNIQRSYSSLGRHYVILRPTLQDIPRAISPFATVQTDDSHTLHDLECVSQSPGRNGHKF